MRILYSVLLSLLLLPCVASCQQEEMEESNERVYVTFRIEDADKPGTRAVPNAPTGTEAGADYESSYKSVDIVFYDSNGNKKVFAGGKQSFHFDASGFTPAESEKSKWVGKAYERTAGSEYLRGVYLDGISKADVEGTTCVVILNLPANLSVKLSRQGFYPKLDDLRKLEVKSLSSGNEQLGPKPYPQKADGTPDYNSPNFVHIMMYGESAPVAFAANQSMITVPVKRTIAKVKILLTTSERSSLSFLAPLTMKFFYRKFPQRTYLGNNRWKPASVGNGQRVGIDHQVDATTPVEVSATHSASKNRNFASLEFYINEYGTLPDAFMTPPYVQLRTEFGGMLTRYFRIMLPRGIQRNKVYTLYATLADAGNEEEEGKIGYSLKITKITVGPWDNGVERFFPEEYYPVKDFTGHPDNTDDQI